MWVQLPSDTPIYWHIPSILYIVERVIGACGFKPLCQYSPSLRVMCYIDKLIKNNTGVSSKNFFLVAVTVIGLILLLVPAVLLIVEVIYNHTIATDLNGLAAYIGAVAAVFTSAGITKAWSEKYEKK